MKKTNFEMISEWHDVFDNGFKDPTGENRERVLLRGKLMLEELMEVFDELHLGLHIDMVNNTIEVMHNSEANKPIDRAKLGKELADLLYVTYGTGDNMDLPMDKIYKEVHRSNMSKLGPNGEPIRREDGKILKGPNYTPADIQRVLDEDRRISNKENV